MSAGLNALMSNRKWSFPFNGAARAEDAAAGGGAQLSTHTGER